MILRQTMLFHEEKKEVMAKLESWEDASEKGGMKVGQSKRVY